MKKRIAAVLLSFCFLLGTLSAAYRACDMDMPQTQAQEMAEMDCHKDMGNAQKIEKAPKKCCIEMSCAKCFGSPFATARHGFAAPPSAPPELAFIAPGHLSSRHPVALERPPKVV